MTNKRPTTDQPLQLRGLALIHIRGFPRCQLPFDRSLWLSGEDEGGKQTLLDALENWHRMEVSLFEPKGPKSLLVYHWQQGEKDFCGIQYAEAGKLKGRIALSNLDSVLATGTPAPTRAWWEALAEAGIRLSPEIEGPRAWRLWLLGQAFAKPAKACRDFLPRPGLAAATLPLLLLRQQNDPARWQQLFRDQLDPDQFPLAALQKQLEACQTDLLAYRQLLRAAPERKDLKKWLDQQRNLEQEARLLTQEWQRVCQLATSQCQELRSQWETGQAQFLLEQNQRQTRIEFLRQRLALGKWLAQSPNLEESAMNSVVDWQQRKLLAVEIEALQIELDGLQEQALERQAPDRPAELAGLELRLRQLHREHPQYILALERATQHLNTLRKEKQRAWEALHAAREQAIEQQRQEKTACEAALRQAEAELKRPPNRFRDWLSQNYPDWEQSVGKLLQPEVLDSRVLMPRLDRIQSSLFGIELHLEDLPAPSLDLRPEQALKAVQARYEQLRQAWTASELAFVQEQKRFQARHRQKIRPAQVAEQEANYALQQHELQLKKLDARLQQLERDWEGTLAQTKLARSYQIHERKQTLSQKRAAWKQLEAQVDWTLAEAQQEWVSILELDEVPALTQELTTLLERDREESSRAEARLQQLQDQLAIAEQRCEQVQALKPTSSPEDDEEATQPGSLLRVEEWLERWAILQTGRRQVAASKSSLWPDFEPEADLSLASAEAWLAQLGPEALANQRREIAQQHLDSLAGLPSRWAEMKRYLQTWEETALRWRQAWRRIMADTPWAALAPQLSVTQHPLVYWMNRVEQFVQEKLPSLGEENLFASGNQSEGFDAAFELLETGIDLCQNWPKESPFGPLLRLELPGLALPQAESAALPALYLQTFLLASQDPLALHSPFPVAEADRVPLSLLLQLHRRAPEWVPVGLSRWPIPAEGEVWMVRPEGATTDKRALPFLAASRA